MPFLNYKDFEDCVRQNQDKRDPRAYCAEIERRTKSRMSAREYGTYLKKQKKVAEMQERGLGVSGEPPSNPGILLTKEQRDAGWYFGGYEDGYYLKYKGNIIKDWHWQKPTQQQVEAEIARISRQPYDITWFKTPRGSLVTVEGDTVVVKTKTMEDTHNLSRMLQRAGVKFECEKIEPLPHTPAMLDRKPEYAFKFSWKLKDLPVSKQGLPEARRKTSRQTPLDTKFVPVFLLFGLGVLLLKSLMAAHES